MPRSMITMVMAAVSAAAFQLALPSRAEEKNPCREDAVLVFDASGSMAGTDMNTVAPHIAKVREALATIMPSISPVRNLGLVTYGPGPWGRCGNIELNVPVQANAGDKILGVVDHIAPAGDTPLTRSVELAAEALAYRDKPATVVLFTDGEETCGGDPCAAAERLKASAKDLTVHVISFKTPVSATLGTGILQTRCLADRTGGTVTTVESKDEIVRALAATLGCPFLTRRPTAFAELVPSWE